MGFHSFEKPLTNVNMSSTEWSDAQFRLLINECKQRNFKYYVIPNKKKRAFWDDVANKLNKQENTNYFLDKDCHKKFLNLTKAFNASTPAWILHGIWKN